MKGAFETLWSIRVESVAERIAVRSSEIVGSYSDKHETEHYDQDLFFKQILDHDFCLCDYIIGSLMTG